MSISDRLKSLYDMVEVSDSGEIAAISSAINFVIENLESVSPCFNLFEYPTKEKINSDFSNMTFTINNLNISFTYFNDNVGKICQKYFPPIFNIILNGTGLTWAELDSSGTFKERDNKFLRWSMIESR